MNAEIELLLLGFQNPHLKEIDLSLGRMHRLLAALGNPQNSLPPAIHVAGTNGKGSLIAYLRAMFEAAGKRVHVYTSPHLVRFHERIVLAGTEVENALLLQALKRVDALKEECPATFFEATTAAAFCLFSEAPADVLLLEVGLGGRLDATNVLLPENVLLTAITPISLDHMDFLGNSLIKIAQEKAGIMKPGVPCVVGPQEAEVEQVLRGHAATTGAPVLAYPAEWRFERNATGMEFQGQGEPVTLPRPSLLGDHQYANAATAVACMDVVQTLGRLEVAVPLNAIAEGVRSAKWPGRLQAFADPFLLSLLPAGSRVWLDGGHNPAAGKMLSQWARSLEEKPYLICGMRSTKDAKGFLSALNGAVQCVVAMPIPGEAQAVDNLALARIAEECGMQSMVAENGKEAVQKITQKKSGDTPINIIISGSLYLVGYFIKEGLHL